MSTNIWKTELYDQKLNYESEFGKDVINLLSPSHGETILDIGCGTGDLAYEISLLGASVIGMDMSATMLDRAKQKYPELTFISGDAQNFKLEKQVDAIFSNAALHWMTSPEKVILCAWQALKENGRFVVEFGGKDNIRTVIDVIYKVLKRDYGIDAASLNPWYFPSIAEYSTLLEQQGFRVVYATHFDRLTEMVDGKNGLRDWLTAFAHDFIAQLAPEAQEQAIRSIEEEAMAELYRDGIWYVDYKRIRVVAIKSDERQDG